MKIPVLDELHALLNEVFAHQAASHKPGLFDEETLGAIFQQVAEGLSSDEGLSPRQLIAEFKLSHACVVCLSESVDAWWTRLRNDDVIDVSYPATSFFNIALQRCNIGLDHMMEGVAPLSYVLLSYSKGVKEVSPAQREAINAFFNEMIGDLRRRPAY